MGETNSVYEALKTYLQEKGISFREITHAAGATAEEYHTAVGCKYEQQAKCLLIKVYADTEYFIIYTLPALKRAGLDQVKTLLNARKVRMANLEELKEHTGCNFGELPPFAGVFSLKLLMDKEFLKEQEIFLNAGKVDVSFVVNPLDLQKVENPVIV